MSEQKWIDQLKHEHDLYKKHLKVYEDENANLKERIFMKNTLVDSLKSENAELKDEVEKLNKINDHLVNQLMHALEIKHESSDNTK